MPDRDRPPGNGRALISFERRQFLGWIGAPALAGLLPGAAQARAVQSARLWPAKEYTRVTIESSSPIVHQLLAVKNPERLVLDLEAVDITAELQQLAEKVSAADPYIQGIRLAVNRPGVTRLVLDLKTEVKPQLFSLPPVAEYGNRLVLDLYPMQAVDPLMALLEEREGAEIRTDAMKPGMEKSRPMTSPARGRRPLIVVLDPGHGGEDPGAIGKRGTYEKDIVLAVAKKLGKRIDRERNMRVLLTRDDDYFVPLQMRVAKARAVKADLFISIHADAFGNRDVRGSSVFALSERGATSAAARWLAQSENRADLIGGVNLDVGDPILARTLLDLSQTASINDSLKLGRFMLEQIGEVNALHKNYVEQAGFAVLKAPDVPSILIETAFISNPDEEKRLRDSGYQHRLADSMLEGIRRYFAQNPPLARS
ncbi:MAG: N-acetylmuramoyl-L-alanine amidase [Betaproteobacteria bacterium]|nr:N-acetylmuramoyl-L-alanine amidase [Betaproteobacteria bacterium]